MAIGNTEGLTHVIQLAVAPVFLLTAVGTTLSVLTARLSRVVDRGRALEQGAPTVHEGGALNELRIVERRARWILRGMSLSTLSGIQVSLLIALAFVGYALDLPLATWLGVLFVGAMASYTGGLVCLLREVYLAAGSFHFSTRKLAADFPPPKAES